MQLVRICVLGMLLVGLIACAAPATSIPPPATISPSVVPTTVVQAPKTAIPTLAATPTSSITADSLLGAHAIDYCEPLAPTRGCGKPLALQIADYLQRHPADPQALALWRHIIAIGQPTQEIGADDPQQMDITWAYDAWAEAEFLALNLPSTLAASPTAAIEIGQLTIIPTNFDGDLTQDYLLHSTLLRNHTRLGKLRLMRWQHNRWVGEHVVGYDNDTGAQVNLGDVTGDAQPELFVRSWRCGSACSGDLNGWTWRDGRPVRLFPEWADTTELQVIQTEPTLSIASPDAVYRFDGQYLSPAELALPTGKFSNTLGTQMRYAHGLLLLGRFDEAITWLERAANQADGSAYFGYKMTLKDARPVALFRIGAIQLLKRDLPAAQATWKHIVERFPRSLVAAAVQKFNLSSFDGSLAQWCQLLDTERPLIMEDYRRSWLDGFALNEFDWLPLCHPRLLLPLHEWTQTTPLDQQFASLGLPWQELSSAYDLNGDGLNDPLGIVDWLGMYTPWAMLSTAAGYQPLYVLQPWSSATNLSTLTDSYLPFDQLHPASITDLDANGAPEWLFDQGQNSYLAAWVGDRFWQNVVSPNQATSAFSATLSLAPQPDATQHVIAHLLPDSLGNQPVPSQIEYGLSAGRFQQLLPARLDMRSSYDYGYSIPTIEASYQALFERNDPALVLAMLAELVQPPPNQWAQHEAMVLKALALEYNGQVAEARQLLDLVANAPEATGWSRFAQQR
ncbi:tetratricopeptide repeat protein [Herpetosiphon llansteffanensis]|uniref:tetratricopeptide repeat protein n=1 Tax=Herpetosiphon llansteffanensis TaxID=2094568 RepID=UPI000F51A6DA|nr:hypothetical protein [Herpetosiphon llansteffanensis]